MFSLEVNEMMLLTVCPHQVLPRELALLPGKYPKDYKAVRDAFLSGGCFTIYCVQGHTLAILVI